MTTTTTVRLTFSATNLNDADFGFGKSDPVARVAMKDATGRMYTVGETEKINNNLNPKWTTEVNVLYVFGDLKTLYFSVVDVDDSGEDKLGSCSSTLDSLIRKGGSTFQLLGNGQLHIVAETVEDSNEFVRMEIRADKIPKMDGIFGKSDPFLVFKRSVVTDGKSLDITYHRTEVVKNTVNPKWKPFTMSVSELCNCDDMRTITVECHDYDSDDSTDFIGKFTTTMGELRNGRRVFELVDPKKKKSRGTVEFTTFDITKRPRFTEFVKAGLEISVNYWIDVTGSNGHPRDDTSLHFTGRQEGTPYEISLRSVHNVLKEYDSDGMVGLGFFGGKFNGSGVTDHAYFAGECKSTDDLCTRYRHVIENDVTFSGPTYFSHIIQRALRNPAPLGTYNVHVILTDGIINDMDNVKCLLRQMSTTATSVLIIGIGNGDRETGFDTMKDLDDGASEEVRDSTDFVAVNDHPGNSLRIACLAELPTHIEDYMHRNGIRPVAMKKK